MFGLLRFILAVLVALTHFKIIGGSGVTPGQWAVVGFFILSGYLMAFQYQKLCPKGGVWPFYSDRFIRIFPIYWLSILVLLPYVSVSFWAIVANVSVVGLNTYPFSGVRVINLPSWSLATEVQFYLLVPWLLRCTTSWLRIIGCLSLGIFAISPWMPVTLFWSYIGLPGLLFTFVNGILLSRKDYPALRASFVAVGACLLMSSWLNHHLPGAEFSIPINVCIGFLTAGPLIFFLSGFSPDHKWDRFLGLLAFPLFLFHDPTACYIHFHLNSLDSYWFRFFISLLVSCLVVFLFERPLDRLRYKLRKRKTLA